MFNTNSKPQPKKQVKLNVINAVELNPYSNYILICDSGVFTRKELEQVMKDIRRAGVKNVVGFMLSGNPEDSIQVIAKERKSATKKSSH